MKRLYWRIYYFFKPEPKTLSDLCIRWARTHGKEYIDLTEAIVERHNFSDTVMWH